MLEAWKTCVNGAAGAADGAGSFAGVGAPADTGRMSSDGVAVVVLLGASEGMEASAGVFDTAEPFSWLAAFARRYSAVHVANSACDSLRNLAVPD